MVYTTEDGKKVNVIAMENGNNAYAYETANETPLFLLDGNVISQTTMYEIDPNAIESITVLKNKNATDKYGEEGKNGVIEISSTSQPSKKKSYAVTKVTYNDNFDTAKNATLFYITKEIKDSEFDSQKREFKSLGINVTFSKIKRNKSGEIVSIKINLNDNNGQKASATYEDPNGISKIRYGVVEDRLIIAGTN